MTTVGVGEAKTHLSRLLKQVESGQEVVIERDGTAVARIVAIHRVTPRFGTLEGQLTVSEDFDDPLPQQIQHYFE